MDVAVLARQGLLDGYDIIVDEVLDVCAQVPGAKPRSFQEFYLNGGYATVSEDGQVQVTPKWDAEVEHVSDALKEDLYRLAKAGMLHLVDECFFMWALPKELLTSGRSFTVYTYLAEGSMLVAYLRKLGIPFEHDVDPAVDAEFRDQARELIEVRDVPRLAKVKLSYTGQIGGKDIAKKVSSALRALRRGALQDVDLGNVLITCVKDRWYHRGINDAEKQKAGPFATGTKLFEGTQWIANTTRGANKYAHASHLIYLYDQNMNPYVRRWLGLSGDPEAQDRYALAELIQWVYRSRVRKGQPIVLFLPSARMSGLLVRWMSEVQKAPKVQLKQAA